MTDIYSSFRPEAVVVDAGDFPTAPLPLRLLAECERIVCCDGAANSYLADPTLPAVWRIVGDGDSLSPDLARKYAAIVRRNPDQETNDQTKAVSYLAARGITRIAIIGATGRREDHTIGNVSLLVDYLARGIDVRIFTDYGVFIAATGRREFVCPEGTQVSVFNFGAVGLHAEGLRYPLRDFTSWWQGTLNETVAPRFSISASGPYLVFINYQ